MKLSKEYIFVLLCIATIFLFHIGKLTITIHNPNIGYGNTVIKPIFKRDQNYDNQTEFQSPYTRNCKQFLHESINKIVDDILTKIHFTDCFKNKTERAEMYGLFNLNFLRHQLGNISCERSKPHFLDTFKPLIALASLPGSGNTWTREILEQTTDVFTGSIYTDTMAFFTGSQLCPTDGRVFIVKTHNPDNLIRRSGCKSMKYSRAIYILRNPYDCIIAEFNRQTSGKTKTSNETDFKSKRWKKTVRNNAKYWEQLTKHWLIDFDKPVHVLVYERLQKNIVFEIFKLMKFMDMPVRLKSLYCLSALNFETYYRKNKPKWMSKEILYSKSQRNDVNGHIESVLATLKRNKGISGILKNYLLSNISTGD